MSEIIEDRVRETTTSAGTGNITVAGASVGFRTFASVCAVNDTFYGAIVAVDVNNNPTGAWEVGYYTYSAANTIARGTVLSSSNNNALVNFTAGTKHVFLDLSAYQIRTFATNPAPSSVTPFGQDASLYTGLTFQDEFNGTTLDTTKWNNHIWYEVAGSVQNYSVASGNLNVWPDTGFVARNIDTDGKYYQTYGYFEVEAKMPIGLGVRPLFWLLSHDTDARPEINIAQVFCGGVAGNWATAAYRPIDYNVQTFQPDMTNAGNARMVPTVAAVDLSAAFHKYGCRWDSTGVSYFFDGVQISRHATTQLNQRMYLILTLAFGRDSGTPTTASTPVGVGNAMQINYVRAWQIIAP